MPSLVDWMSGGADASAHAAVRYFRLRFPKIKQYRAKPVGLPEGVARIVRTDEAGRDEVVYRRPDVEPGQGTQSLP